MAKGEKVILQNPECYHYSDLLSFVDQHLTHDNYLSFACFSLDKYTTDHFENVFTDDYFETLVKTHHYAPLVDGEAGWYNHSQVRPDALHFCTAITKKNIEKLGGFDERFALGIGYDDNEWIERVRKILDVNIIDDAIALHQNHYNPQSTSYQNNPDRHQLSQFNKYIYLNRVPYLNFNQLRSIIPSKNKKASIKRHLKFESFLRYLKIYKPPAK